MEKDNSCNAVVSHLGMWQTCHIPVGLANFYEYLLRFKECENPYARIAMIGCSLSLLASIRQEESRLSRLFARSTLQNALRSGNDRRDEEGPAPVHPCTLMPLELWLYLADQMPDSTTWHSFSNSNQLFYDSLESRRVSALLPEVLRIIFKRLPGTEFPRVDVLQCRRACKRWKNSVDCFMSNQEGRLDISENNTGIQSWPALRYHATWIFWDEARKLEDTTSYFLDLWKTTGIPQNPFPSRDFAVVELRELDSDIDIPRFRNAVTGLLRHFGNQLLGFSYSSDISNDGVCWCWHYTVCGWLKLMPNLKRVNLVYRIEKRITHEQLNELHDLLDELPFPKLEKLVTIQFDNVPFPVLHSALLMNPHIQKLKIDNRNHYYGTSGMLWRSHGSTMNQLTDLFIVAKVYRDITQLQTLNCPLRSLQIFNALSTKIGSSYQVFQILKKFRATLTYLKLELHNAPCVKEPLFLENLTSLHVIFHEFVNLDFILPLKALQNLSVAILHEDFEKCDEKLVQIQHIQFAYFIDKLELSNIWGLFPNLEKIFIDTSHCRNRFKSKRSFLYSRSQIFH